MWLGILSSLVFLWLVTRRVSWPQMAAALQGVQWGLALAGLLLITAVWGVFALRWRVLLAPAAPVGWPDTFAYIMLGYLGNSLLPLRLGDVGRVSLISQKHGLHIGFTTATAVLEKLLDLLMVVALAVLLVPVVPLPDVVRRGVQIAAATTLGAFAGLALLARSERALAHLTVALPRRLSALLAGNLSRFTLGLKSASSFAQALKVVLLSWLAWGLAFLSMLCFVRAFGLPVPWEAALLVVVVTNLGGAIPSSPGAVGVYEFLAVTALAAWLPDRSASLGFAVTVHGLYLGLIAALGTLAAWRESVRLSALVGQRLAVGAGQTTLREDSQDAH